MLCLIARIRSESEQKCIRHFQRHTKEKATLTGSLFCFSETLLNLWKQNTKQMKSTQLRIGNWYNEYGIPKQATPEIISNLYTIEQNGKTAIDFDFLPLTEEWLLKCTNYTKWKYFGEHYGGYFDLFGNWKLMLRYFNGEFTFLIVTVNREKDFFKSVKEINIDINYVHQLQNFIFANRSKELEFKL